jgi:hypothetical protein
LKRASGIVDAVVKEKLPFLAHGEKLSPCWDKFYTLFRSKKLIRNKIVHGNIGNFMQMRNKKFRICLVPPVLDHVKMRAVLKPDQWPGMSVNDVEHAGKNFSEMHRTLIMFHETLQEVRKVPYDWQASLEKLDKLQKRLRLSPDPSEGNQRPQEP